MAGRGSTDFDKAGAAGRLAKEQRERLCQEQGGKYKYKTDQRQHKTTLAQSRENVFVRNKEVNANTKQTKQHSPKSRRVINKEVNMTTKTNKHNNLSRCIIQTPNKKK